MNTHQSLVDNINNDPSGLFVPKSFFRENRNVPITKSFKFSYNGVPGMGSAFGIDIDAHIYSNIVSEFNVNIVKVITSDMYNTSNYEAIDMRELSYTDITNLSHNDTRKIIDDLYLINQKDGYTNLITSGSLACVLQDHSGFSIIPSNGISNSSGDIYHIGRIFGVNVWVDPYMRYDDDRFVFFNDIDINIDNIKASVVSEATFNPRILFMYDIGTSPIDSKVVYVVNNESSPGWLKIKQINRGIKINQILDEEE